MTKQEYHVLLRCRALRKSIHEMSRNNPSFGLMFRCVEVDVLYFELLSLLKHKQIKYPNYLDVSR